MKVSATYIYSGMPDYWGGDGDRWDDNKGCLFSYYGPTTTLRELVDGWIDDYNAGGDCDKDAFTDVTTDDLRNALLEMLSDQGRADYESDAIAECAQEFADANPDYVEDEDAYCDSPVAIVLVSIDED